MLCHLTLAHSQLHVTGIQMLSEYQGSTVHCGCCIHVPLSVRERISHYTPRSWTGSKRSRHGKTGPIHFYHKSDPYFEFTSFHVSPIELDSKNWATTENYFQAQKYIGTPLYGAIQECGTAREAFTISRSPQGSRWRRCDWEEVKQDVMYVALYAKFTQHSDLKKRLLGTGDRPLVEHAERDRYWGDGGDGRGENHLGKLLMKLRNELFEEEKVKSNKRGDSQKTKEIETFLN